MVKHILFSNITNLKWLSYNILLTNMHITYPYGIFRDSTLLKLCYGLFRIFYYF